MDLQNQWIASLSLILTYRFELLHHFNSINEFTNTNFLGGVISFLAIPAQKKVGTGKTISLYTGAQQRLWRN
jgi:hypothetical protein